LPLAYLVQSGDLFAGDMMLFGQTLYVAGGQGDVQLFDVSPWLDNRFRVNIELQNYFSVLGDVGALAFGGDAIYAGTAFVNIGGEPAENPFEAGTEITNLSGALNTIVNDLLTISEQVPAPRGFLPANAPIEVQFNKILDQPQILNSGDELFTVTLNGVPVEGFVSSQINNMGTRLFFRPVQEFEDQREYRVTLSGAIRDLQNATLNDDYSFRFVAVDAEQPRIEDVTPRFGSWRGGGEIFITGENFDLNTVVEIGGVQLQPEDITQVRPDEIAFRLPPLRAPPPENILVGLSVANGLLEAFRAGAFTYVTDPKIEEIGLFNPLTNEFFPAKHRLMFNAGEFVAITGPGLNPLTRLQVNGRTPPEVEVQGPEMISFRVPDETLGTLTVSVSNLEDDSDADTNTDLFIQLPVFKQIGSVDGKLYRNGDFLILTRSVPTRSGQPPRFAADLYTTQDGDTPVRLSTMIFDGRIHNAALSDRYAIFSVGDQHELVVFDLENIYAPSQVNRILNEEGVTHKRLFLNGARFFSFGNGAIRMGQLHGAEWETVPVDAVDAAADDKYIYLLFDLFVEARSFNDPDTVAATLNHLLVAPQRLKASEQRLLLFGGTNIELFDTAHVDDKDEFTNMGAFLSLGNVAISGLVDAALNGELMALLTNSGGTRLELFDVAPAAEFDTKLQLRKVVQLRTDSVFLPGADGLAFNNDLVEWAKSGSYVNAVVPVPNLARPIPLREIGGAGDIVALRVTGASRAWERVILDVEREADAHILAGDSRVLGEQLQFLPIGDSYQIGDTFRLSLFNPPRTVIDGADLEFDMPWRLRTVPLFGAAEVELRALAPATTISSRVTPFTIKGNGLDALTRLTLNGAEIPQSDWVINEDGTSLSFTTSLDVAGLYTLRAEHPAGEEVLPAAISVAQALTINHIRTDNPRGENLISDSGGTRVIVDGLGFDGSISVHWLEEGIVQVPAQGNIRNF
ncbi:MAG: IPT/TIG domain-containing protein, partial [Gammaproteobacteria bacterium]|nr:IPT/TIG domain-containing protein [Gammaproteobacteria bacterium]